MFYWKIYEVFKSAEAPNGGVPQKKALVKISQY